MRFSIDAANSSTDDQISPQGERQQWISLLPATAASTQLQFFAIARNWVGHGSRLHWRDSSQEVAIDMENATGVTKK